MTISSVCVRLNAEKQLCKPLKKDGRIGMEWIVLGLFCAALVLGLAWDISMLWALGFGLALFW